LLVQILLDLSRLAGTNTILSVLREVLHVKEKKMSHFAQIDENNIVTRVIVIDQETVDTGLFGELSSFVQTSYNTRGGVHTLGGTPLRKNYAGIGYTYDTVRDAFIPPKPFNSWTLNESTCWWDSPVVMPDDGKEYTWNEDTLSWVENA
jgi:hypothetical protein